MSKKGDVVSKQVDLIHREIITLMKRAGLDQDITVGVHEATPCTRTEEGCAEVKRRKLLRQTVAKTIHTSEYDDKTSYVIKIFIGSGNLLSFHQNIGFVYCGHKQSRLNVVAAWHRSREILNQQRRKIAEKAIELRQNGLRSIKTAVEAAKKQLAEEELLHPNTVSWNPPYNKNLAQSVYCPPLKATEILDAWSIRNYFSDAHKAIRYNSKQPKVNAKKRSFDDMQSEYENNEDDNELVDADTRDKVRYATHRDTDTLPLYYLRVVGRRHVGKRRVWDLSVPLPEGENGEPSFVAAGKVVHNCYKMGGVDGLWPYIHRIPLNYCTQLVDQMDTCDLPANLFTAYWHNNPWQPMMRVAGTDCFMVSELMVTLVFRNDEYAKILYDLGQQHVDALTKGGKKPKRKHHGDVKLPKLRMMPIVHVRFFIRAGNPTANDPTHCETIPDAHALELFEDHAERLSVDLPAVIPITTQSTFACSCCKPGRYEVYRRPVPWKEVVWTQRDSTDSNVGSAPAFWPPNALWPPRTGSHIQFFPDAVPVDMSVERLEKTRFTPQDLQDAIKTGARVDYA
jgi:hypothetical protein